MIRRLRMFLDCSDWSIIMDKKYRNYFNINESYFPAVNEDVIRTQPDYWKTYYPHESFIKLLNQTKSVLTNTQRMSIWVEGAYGTGKSHAVLTLKKLLDSSNDELKEYFDKYSDVLSHDLYSEFYNIKNQERKVLTVHRYGSSDVRNDKILMEYIQESIIKALKENGFSYFGQVGLKDAMIDWLSIASNKNYFNEIIHEEEYRVKFGGISADDVLNQLKTWTADKAVQELIEKVSSVGEDKGIKPFVLHKEDLKTWILDVIGKNNLKAIFFIWDEFSDYFDLNKGNLSGFQFLVEMSETQPFYLCIVTHKSDIFFENSKDDVKTKINGRFIAPHCSIELPDNMAFILTAHAMQKVEDDASIQKEWDETVDDLYDLTHDSRNEVIKSAKIGEKELKGVLPIHPYAALVLKHIASAFDSNQRSMFDFIKNDRGDEIKGFQWFIDNYGPEDDDSLLTVDFLWDFFYEKGKDQLAPQIRQILDVYGRTESHKLMCNQKRVLKTILLLQAINEKVGDSVSLFIPNDKNLGLAFEGTGMTPSNVEALAKSLVKEQIIFERPMGGGANKYSALVSSGNQEEIEKEKERLQREIRTDKLIEEGDFLNDFKLPAYLAIRYPNIKLVTYENMRMSVAQLKNDSENHSTRLYAVYTFARNSDESIKIRQEIDKTFNDGFEKVVFIDYSQCNLSDDMFNQYIENMANCNFQKGKDAAQSRTYDRNAKESLKRWKIQIKCSSPKIFTINNRIGTVCNNESEVYNYLKDFDEKHFTCAIETHVNVIDTMFVANYFKQGAECGITGQLKGPFKSANENTKLDKQFAGVWNVDNYWTLKPNELLSKVKIVVEKVIKDEFRNNTRVSISDIYDALIDKPFGFMPCNLTAFILGFVLREYATEEYNWTDDLTTVPMSVDKLKEMIDEIIKQQQIPNPKYKPKYIVAMSPEQKEFNKCTSIVFDIAENLCSSVENTKSQVRSRMIAFKFPIWTLKFCNFDTSVSQDVINKVIDLYVELANNSTSSRTETDIALEIGSIFINNEGLVEDLKNILTKENCTNGMQKYLERYKNGVLPDYARRIGDTGSYINEISKKFSSDSSWVWNIATINEKVDETITEYKIVFESNKLISRTSSYDDCLKEWIKKIDTFKIAFSTIRSDVGELSDFLNYLYQIKKNGAIYDVDKENFLDAMIKQEACFNGFCGNQITLLKESCSFYLEGLTDDDVFKIASTYLNGVYDLENSDFQNKLNEAVRTYKSSIAKYMLDKIWKEKTETLNPREWSYKYSMPILSMLPVAEQNDARIVFELIGTQTNDKSKIDDAINYLNNFKYYDDLNNSFVRDAAFRKTILKTYSTLIDDINDVKLKIKSKFPTINPYYWLGNAEIDKYIEKIAYQKYISGVSSKVNAIIDSMSPEELKVYLKSMVKENMVVGMEIINAKK